MKNILIPTDFSETAKGAFLYAAAYAKKIGGAQLKVVNILMPEIASEYPYLPPTEEYLTARKAQMSRFMEEALNDLEGGGIGLDFELDILVGFPVDEISRISKDFDLVVMGATGESGILGKMFGSISSGVSLRAHCPVLLIPKKSEFKDIEHILYACGCNDFDDDMVSLLKSLNKPFNANIHFIHVKKGQSDKFAKTKAQIFNALFGDDHPSFSFEFSEIEGAIISDSLNNYAQNNHIDMIVMVTQHRTILGQIFHRSETKHMALASQVPLLVFHDNDV